ncbi:MAG: cell division protein ZapD [Woeseiaceae bacterium]|nr:cell division protein ZapD [Woeseiaceae bacterium]NIP21198.1 cell division protein ZapD [Woeseiaceae bacterium]NIS90170.1 cell division protein ZapD [Woeseiaceae bacterium]
MAKPATTIHLQPTGGDYEQPVSERMRTFMRLEFLYRQMLYNCELETDWSTRATIGGLLEILAILSRGDVRSEVHKELDHQLDLLQRFQSQPGVDKRRLETLVHNLIQSRTDVDGIGTGYLQTLKQSDFLNAIKNRSTIPGGTCEFDLPEYSHWLRQSHGRRQQDLEMWIGAIRPLCDAVLEALWLIRESGQPVDKVAINGMYQHNMQKDAHCRLLRVTLPAESTLYPEISGSQHRFTVRFLEWSTVDSRAVQTGHDVPFQLSIC